MVFCAAITRILRRGEQPDCNCFGKVHSAPIGWRTLARNGALAAMAVLVAAAGPGQGIGDALAGVRVTTVGVVLVLISLAVAFEGFVGWQLFRQNGRLLERVRALEDAAEDRGMRTPEPAGLPVGHPAPTFELADLHGRKRTLADLLAPGLPVALVFSDPDCGACVELAPRLGRLREEHAGSLEIALISRGTPAENRALLGGGRLEDVLLQEDREVLAAFRIDTVPSAMIVDPDGRIATPTGSGYPAIEELLASAATPVSERLRVAAG
jgi:peroxiredoxin